MCVFINHSKYLLIQNLLIMKHFRNYFMLLAVCGLLVTSCSQEDESIRADGDKATLSFGPALNDMLNKVLDKQVLDEIPECSDEAPAYVDVVLSRRVNGSTVPAIGTTQSPLRLEVSPSPGDYDGDGTAEYFTEEHPNLELEPDRYYLDYFVVRNSAQQVLWIAPMDGSTLGDFVDTALPIPIDLEAGVKEYVDVNVLCYDERIVREYGYLFFDIHQNEALQYCFFANYCDPNGRHFSARYEVDVWTLNDDGSRDYIYQDEPNFSEINEDNETFADPLCLILPNLSDYEDDEDYIFYEARLLDWVENGAYGNIEETDYVISGSLSRNDIMNNYVSDTEVDYEHLRFGCTGDPGGNTNPCPGTGDTDEDGIGNGCDNCVDTPNPNQEDTDGDGIGDACEEPGGNTNPCPGTGDSDEDGIGDACDNCVDTPNFDQDDSNDNGIGDACDYVPGPGNCDETAFMFGDNRFWDLDLGNRRWGWAEHVTTGETPFTAGFHAGAGQNDTNRGFRAGDVTVSWNESTGDVTVAIDLKDDVSMDDVHIYFSDTDAPHTNAPGQYGYSEQGLVHDFESTDGDFWIIVHAEVCE